FLQFRMEGCQPGLDFAEPARETIDVSRSLLGLAARVNQPAIRFALFGSRFKLGATPLFRGLAGVCQCRFGRGHLLDRRFFRRAGAIAIRLAIAHVFLERFKLGTPLQRSPPTRCRRRAELEALERSEEHTSELQSRFDLVCRLLLEKKNNKTYS